MPRNEADYDDSRSQAVDHDPHEELQRTITDELEKVTGRIHVDQLADQVIKALPERVMTELMLEALFDTVTAELLDRLADSGLGPYADPGG